MEKMYKTLLRKGISAMIVLVMTIAMAMPCFAAAVPPSNVSQTGYDIVLVADNSRSIWWQQADRDKALGKIINLAVGSDIRVGGVYFADHVYKKLALTSVETQDGAQEVLNNFLKMTEQDESNRDTNIGKGLEAGLELFQNSDQSRKKIVILFSDGINENYEQEDTYRQQADEDTRNVAVKLQEMDIPLYCVYLQRDRNDEAYLKELVNYFSADNHYDAERFKKATTDHIEDMASQFVEVFYAIQNDMKYRTISVDSSGKMNFYVPSMAVRKVQLYLDNDMYYEGVITDPNGSTPDIDLWQEDNGTSIFATIENPTPGEWTLSMTGDNVQATRGTIAYYTDLNVDTLLVEIADGVESTTKIGRNKGLKLRVFLYDDAGNSIEVDPATAVTGSITIQKENGETVAQELSFSVENGACYSNEFKVDSFCTINGNLHIAYQDFVDLSYEVPVGTIEPQAPTGYEVTEKFTANKTEDGRERFSIKLGQLFDDPDGEELHLNGVSSQIDDNPVEAVIQDGYLVVTAAKEGSVKFNVNISDESGLTAVATVDSKVEDQESVDRKEFVSSAIKVLIVLIILILLYMGIARKIREKKSKKDALKECKKIRTKILRNCKEIKETIENFEKKDPEKDNLQDKISEQLDDLKTILEGDDESGLLELTFAMDTHMLESYQDSELPEDANDEERRFAKLSACVDTRKNCLDVYNERYESVKSAIRGIAEWSDNLMNRIKDTDDAKMGSEVSQKELMDAKQELEEQLEEVCSKQAELQSQIEELKKQSAQLENIVDFVYSAREEISEVLATDIDYDIMVHIDKFIGGKRFRSDDSEHTKGYIALDEIPLTNGKKLSDMFIGGGRTDIYMFNVQNEADRQVFKLQSANLFSWKRLKGDDDMPLEAKDVKEAEFLKGRYRITCVPADTAPEYVGVPVTIDITVS